MSVVNTLGVLTPERLNLVRSIAHRLATQFPPNITEDDLYSAGLFRLAKHLQSYDPGKGPFEPWIRQTVRGGMLNYVESEFADRTSEMPIEVPDEAPLPDAQVIETERRAQLHRAVVELPSDEQSVIERVLAGETETSIARTFGISRFAVIRRRCAAVRRIRPRVMSALAA